MEPKKVLEGPVVVEGGRIARLVSAGKGGVVETWDRKRGAWVTGAGVDLHDISLGRLATPSELAGVSG